MPLDVLFIDTISKQALDGWLGVHLIDTIGKQALNGWLGVHGHGFQWHRPPHYTYLSTMGLCIWPKKLTGVYTSYGWGYFELLRAHAQKHHPNPFARVVWNLTCIQTPWYFV
jgi:hypothetical protein